MFGLGSLVQPDNTSALPGTNDLALAATLRISGSIAEGDKVQQNKMMKYQIDVNAQNALRQSGIGKKKKKRSNYESYTDYPDSVKNNAKAVLKYVEENNNESEASQVENTTPETVAPEAVETPVEASRPTITAAVAYAKPRIDVTPGAYLENTVRASMGDEGKASDVLNAALLRHARHLPLVL